MTDVAKLAQEAAEESRKWMKNCGEPRVIVIDRGSLDAIITRIFSPAMSAKDAEIERLRNGCTELSRAVSRIDYLMGEPNEMECSSYDVHADPQAVVDRVTAMQKQLADRDREIGELRERVAASKLANWAEKTVLELYRDQKRAEAAEAERDRIRHELECSWVRWQNGSFHFRCKNCGACGRTRRDVRHVESCVLAGSISRDAPGQPEVEKKR